MREVKFRAFERSNNAVREVTHIDFELNLVRLILGRECESNWVLQDEFTFENVELMQYTGLKDKNGVEIYEGDIITGKFKHFTNKSKILNWKGVVVFSYSCFDIDFIDGKHTNCLSNKLCYDIQVIGNIYENKELLK